MNITQNVKSFIGLADPIRNTEDLFIHGLKDIYYAEKHLVDGLEKMADKANSSDLKAIFTQHRQETINQVARIESIFELMNVEIEDNTCEAIEGLMDETEEALVNAEDHMIDEVLVFAAQAIEHYEIARYTSLLGLAQKLGQSEVAQFLIGTLTEETEASVLLSHYAGVQLPSSVTVAMHSQSARARA